MMLIKLSIVTDSDRALTAEASLLALQEADMPPVPLAVSRFEAPLPLWRVEAYFSAEDASAVAMVADGLDVGDWQVEPVPETNWVGHVHATLKPVRAGRFLVHGPHDRAAAEGEPFAIEIEASEAFGTAHHGSTVGCLRAIDRLELKPAARVLDLGTGSGILAIAVAKTALQPQIIATDIDPPSVAIAEANCRENGVAEAVTCLVADGLDHPQLAAGQFDLIIANILAEPLITLAPNLVRAMQPGGQIVLAGLLVEQAEAVIAAYQAAGCTLQESDDVDGWATLKLHSVHAESHKTKPH
jgi:ribosomal protein L11 methyltransferase